VLNPSGLRKVLLEFAITTGQNRAVRVNQQCGNPGGASINRQNSHSNNILGAEI
jgi:hypothetical protein